MANYGPSSGYLLIGGKDVSGDVTGLTETVEELAVECRGLGASVESWKSVGVAKITLETEPNIYDDRTTGMLAAMQDAPTTKQLLGYGFGGATLGASAVMVDGTYVSTFKKMAQRDGLTMGQGMHKVSGTYYRGKVVGTLTTRSGDGDTEAASYDGGAGSSNGAIVDLHVPALSLGGGTNVIVKVRHSADNITFADLTTFTAVTVAGSSERKTLAGAVDRYIAISWAFTGGSAQTVKPYVSFYRIP